MRVCARLSQQREAKIIILKLCIVITVTVTLEAKHQELWFISTGNLYQSHKNNMIGNTGPSSVVENPFLLYTLCAERKS